LAYFQNEQRQNEKEGFRHKAERKITQRKTNTKWKQETRKIHTGRKTRKELRMRRRMGMRRRGIIRRKGMYINTEYEQVPYASDMMSKTITQLALIILSRNESEIIS